MTHSSWWALRLSWHHQESNQPIQTGTATKHKKHVKLHVQTGKALAHTTRPAICLHSSALGHWPEPAGALVGRAGPTLATAAPAPWHLQSPLPTQRGRTLLCGTLLCMGTHSPQDHSYSPGSCTPREPSTLQEPLLGAPHSHDLLPILPRFPPLPRSPWMWQCSQHCASSGLHCHHQTVFSSLFSIDIHLQTACCKACQDSHTRMISNLGFLRGINLFISDPPVDIPLFSWSLLNI